MASHHVTSRGLTVQQATGEEEDSDISASNLINDVMDSNPTGRSTADDRGKQIGASLWNVTRIGPWNIRTVYRYRIGKLTNVIREMNRCSIQMLGIAETHWTRYGHFNATEGELVSCTLEEITTVQKSE